MRRILDLLKEWPPYPEGAELLEATTQVKSSSWTGKRSAKEIIYAVRQMAPIALDALDLLIVENERRFHNSTPEPAEAEALRNLRLLHEALGELLDAAERGAGLKKRLNAVAALATRTFELDRWTGVTVRGLKVLGFSLLPTFAAVKALEFMFGQSFDAQANATVAAGVMALTHFGLQSPASPKSQG